MLSAIIFLCIFYSSNLCGTHLNISITIANVTKPKMKLNAKLIPIYFIAQIIGASLAAVVCK